jgi:hypothetical protein
MERRSDGTSHPKCLRRGVGSRAWYSASASSLQVIALGGTMMDFWGFASAEVYEEVLGQWRFLPCVFPNGAGINFTGSALMCR